MIHFDRTNLSISQILINIKQSHFSSRKASKRFQFAFKVTNGSINVNRSHFGVVSASKLNFDTLFRPQIDINQWIQFTVDGNKLEVPEKMIRFC